MAKGSIASESLYANTRKYKDDYNTQTTNIKKDGHWCIRYKEKQLGIFNVKCIKINTYI